MNRKQVYKNLTCACFGLLLVSISALVMIQIFYSQDISSQIQNISVIKDIKYPLWGKNPNPSGSQFFQTITLYNLEQIDGQIHTSKSKASKTFEYNYEYQNVSFAQGNSGRINFINKWQLKQINTNAPTQETIKTINLGADKVYNYDYYAPPQRKIPILYNSIVNTISGEFLQKFYALYLLQFFFSHQQLVYETVFKPLGYSLQRATQIYKHQQLGWSTLQNFKKWVKLSLKGKQYAQTTQQYQQFIVQLNLSSKQLSNLIFQRSTIYNMIAALNGTIQSKLSQAKLFGYKCENDVCSNQQLAAFQISSAFLTSDPLFSSLGLNITSKDLNNTFLTDIQYTRFCDQNKDEFTCLPDKSKAVFFTEHMLGDFEMMDILWNNKNNIDYIQDKFKIPQNTGLSIVKYVQYIYEEMIKKYQNNNIFAWAQTNYYHIQNIVTMYKNLFLVQLYARAFQNKFIKNTDKKCEDYFSGEFQKYQDIVCNNQSSTWNLLKTTVIRKYIQAYFFINSRRDQMNKQIKMSYDQIITLFRNTQKSLFAKQIAQIDAIFRTSFGCPQNSLGICSPDQLFCMQWGQNKIFQNLPTDIFQNKVNSILEWDTKNILNGIVPDYNAIIGKTKSVQQCLSILSSNQKQGIYSFFNLLDLGKRSQIDQDSHNILKYVGRNVISINFKGLLKTQNINNIFHGYKSQIIQQKQKMNISSGGAPWLQNQIKLLKTDNKQQIRNNQLQKNPQYNILNTGIYDSEKTRELSKIWGQIKSSSKYTVYKGKKQDQDGKQIDVNIFQKYVTDREIKGTNLLGFKPNIQNGQNLLSYIEQAYQSMVLVYDSQLQYQDKQQLQDNIRAIKYKLVLNNNNSNNNMQDNKSQTFIGIQQLNHNYFALSNQSSIIVQPITGLTLQKQLLFTKYLFTSQHTQYTSSLSSQVQPIQIYESKIYYKRKGLSQLQNINNDINKKSLYTMIGIGICAASFIFTAAFGAMYFKNRKFKDQIQQSLVTSQNKQSNQYI